MSISANYPSQYIIEWKKKNRSQVVRCQYRSIETFKKSTFYRLDNYLHNNEHYKSYICILSTLIYTFEIVNESYWLFYYSIYYLIVHYGPGWVWTFQHWSSMRTEHLCPNLSTKFWSKNRKYRHKHNYLVRPIIKRSAWIINNWYLLFINLKFFLRKSIIFKYKIYFIYEAGNIPDL